MMGELKPCPFCGDKAEMAHTWRDNWQVNCPVCSCIQMDSFYGTEADAIAAWNRRASSNNQALELEDRLRQLSLEHVGTMTENAELKSIIKELISAIEQSSFCKDCQDEFGTLACSECPWAQARNRGKKWMEEESE